MACFTPVMQHTFEQCCWQTFSSREPTQGRRLAAFVEHPLDVDRRKDVVVDAVAVFLLDRGIEKREARADHDRIACQHTPVRELNPFAAEPPGFGTGHHLDPALGNAAAQFGEYLRRRGERREQHVPSPELAAQIGLFLDDRRTDAAIRKPQCGLNTGDTAAYDDNLSFHCALIL